MRTYDELWRLCTCSLENVLNCSLFVALICLAVFLSGSTRSIAQTENATLQGTVMDPSGAVIPQAQVTITNVATGAKRSQITNNSGEFVGVGLSPGTYSVHVQHEGFQAVDVSGVALSVGAREHIAIHFAVGSANQVVNVEGSDIQLTTTSAAVSTVVDQKEVANMPLNGRSFQDLMLLVPGVTTASSQTGNPTNQNGVSLLQVNGDTGFSNSYTVDGVSANFGAGNAGGFVGIGGSGGLPASTILGSTQALVPVDDLQEFRVETSSYGAEYGGYSGGQFVFVTRSGSNQFHGSASDYLRNTVLDANDYFNNYYGVARQPLQQNDFSATFGGPVRIPHLYNGKNKTFFFFDYEGLRANIPIATYLQYSPDAALVAAATGPIQQFLASLPKPNGPDLGDGLAEYTAGYPSKNDLNTYNLRIDEMLSTKEEIFARASNTRSSANSYSYGEYENLTQDTRTYTLGLTSSFTSHITNQLRGNFSSNAGDQQGNQTQEPNQPSFNPITAAGYPANIQNIIAGIYFYPAVGNIYAQAYRGINETRQIDFPDNVTWVHGTHQIKFGVDFRRLTSTELPESPLVGYDFYSSATLIANAPDYVYNDSYDTAYPSIIDFAAYAQDEWQVSPKLTLSYGLRWDYMPPATVRRGGLPLTLINQNNLAALAVGPAAEPYDAYYYDFGPRLGVTYLVRNTPGFETQIRGGAGLFYDSAANQGNSLLGLYSPGFTGTNTFCSESYCNINTPVSFPLPINYRYTPIDYPPVPPFSAIYYATSPHFANPYTVQTNVALQQNLGKSDAITFNYVGAFYRKGIEDLDQYIQAINPNFTFVDFQRNGLRSAYNSGQVVYQHRVSHGLFGYAAYTWSHAITENQINGFTPYEKSDASGDLRNNFNAVLTWDIPYTSSNFIRESLLGHWGTDVRFLVRTGFPITLTGLKASDAADDGESIAPGLNFVPNTPLYLYGSYDGTPIPGGKQLNPAAFTAAPVGVNGNVPLNYFRGFGANQWNMAIRRDFPIYDTLHLQFRAEAFNMFNRPNFGTIDAYLPDPTFGQATNSLASALAPGANSAQYQSGGPRSMQIALKILF